MLFKLRAKLLFLSFLILASLVTSCNSENENVIPQANLQATIRDINDCMADEDDFPGTICNPLGSYTNAITLSGYPSCYINISVPYFLCTSGGSSFISIGTISITGSGCSPTNQFEADLLAASASGTAAMQAFLNPIYAEIYGIITPTIINQNATVITIKYAIAQCVITCLEERYRGQFSYWVPVETPCGDKCCARTDEYRRINGEWKLISSDIEINSTNCDSLAGPLCTGSGTTPTYCYGRCGIWNDF